MTPIKEILPFDPIDYSAKDRNPQDQVFLAPLPTDVKVMVSQYLDLDDLTTLRAVEAYWNCFLTHDRIWRPIAARINCTALPPFPVYKQVALSIKDLMRRFAFYLKAHDGADLEEEIQYVEKLTFDRIAHLQKWISARDTIQIWQRLIRQLENTGGAVFVDPDIGHTFEEHMCNELSLATSQQQIDKAAEFASWCDLHKEQLAQVRSLSDTFEEGPVTNVTSLPPHFSALTGLEELDLEDGALNSVPPEIHGLTQIRRLNLSHHRFRAIPPELCLSGVLTDLNLNGNRISELPAEICTLPLRNLSLRGNQLSTLPNKFSALTNLSYLELSENQFSAVPPELSPLESLERLNLENNPFPDEYLRSLPKEVSSLIAASPFLVDVHKVDSFRKALALMNRK